VANGVPEPSAMYWATGIAVSLLVHGSAVAGAALWADRYVAAARPPTEITFTDEGSPTVQPEEIVTEAAIPVESAEPVPRETLVPEVAPEIAAEAVPEPVAPLEAPVASAEVIEAARVATLTPEAAEPLKPEQPAPPEALPSAPSEPVAAVQPDAVQPAEAEPLAPQDAEVLPLDRTPASQVQPSALPEIAPEASGEITLPATPPETAPETGTAETVAPGVAADEFAPSSSAELLPSSSSAEFVSPEAGPADTLSAEPPPAVAAAPPPTAPIEIPESQAETAAPIGSEALAPSAAAENVAPSTRTEALSPATSAELLSPSSSAEEAPAIARPPVETLPPVGGADGVVAVEVPRAPAPLAAAETGPAVVGQPEAIRPESVQPQASSTEAVTSLTPEALEPSAVPPDAVRETVVPIEPETVAPVEPEVEAALPVPRPDWSNDTPRQRYGKMVDLIRDYAGGDCFIALPALRPDGSLTLQTFGRDAAVENEFEETLGGIDGHGAMLGNDTIADPQCQALSFTRQMKRYPDFSMIIDLDEAAMAHRPVLSGSVRNARGAELYLFLVDEEGNVLSIDETASKGPDGAYRFSVPLTLTGPRQPAAVRQLLMAVTTDRPLKVVDINEQAAKFLPFMRNLIATSGANVDVAVKGFSLR
jgi:hypothetical protein